MSIREWAALARSEGLDAIDLSAMLVSSHTPVYLEKLKADLTQEEMGITMMTTYPDFTHPDRLQREREMEYARYDVAVSAELGVKYLRILAGQAYPETNVREGISWVVESFKRLDEVANRHGLKLLFENHSKPGAWRYSDFSHPTDIFLEILAKISDTGIRVNYDTANTLVFGDESFRLLEAVVDKIETVHVADTGALGRLEAVVIGEGIVPFGKVFSRLKEVGFDGWLCIEEASGKGRRGLSKAIEFVRSCWNAK
jgi:sugar phosphate isomerase/epimerase